MKHTFIRLCEFVITRDSIYPKVEAAANAVLFLSIDGIIFHDCNFPWKSIKLPIFQYFINTNRYNTDVKSQSVFSARRIIPNRPYCHLITSLMIKINACFFKFDNFVLNNRMLAVDDHCSINGKFWHIYKHIFICMFCSRIFTHMEKLP